MFCVLFNGINKLELTFLASQPRLKYQSVRPNRFSSPLHIYNNLCQPCFTSRFHGSTTLDQ